MKSVIIGAHGVWKTTLLQAIEYENKITEIARDLIESIGVAPQNMTKPQQIQFQKNIYREQRKAERELDSFISDRSVYDNLAYAQVLCEDLSQQILESILNTHDWYDNVFYVPIEFELKSDWVRFEEQDFQKTIDETILHIVKLLNIPIIEVKWSLAQRKEIIESYLK